MRRRLYWLLPDVESARRTADDLLLARVEDRHMPLSRSGIPQPQRSSGRPSGAVQAMDAPEGEVCPVPRNLTPSDILLFAVVNSTSRACMAVMFG